MKRLVLILTLSSLVACGGSQNSGGGSPPPTAKPSCSLTASPTMISQGSNQSVSLNWNVLNAVSGSIDNGVGVVNLGVGLVWVSPTAPTTYTLTVNGSGGSATCNASVGMPVIVTTSASEIYTLDTAQFTVTLSGTTNAVVWTVDGGDANGTIDANGLYTAPPVHPDSAHVKVIATSTTDASYSGFATVKLLLGNGTQRYAFDANVPSSLQNFAATLNSKRTPACGSASDNAPVTVPIDDNQAGGAAGGMYVSGISPKIYIGSLAASQDPQFATFLHESTHGLWNSLFKSPFSGTSSLMREGFAEGCTQLVLQKSPLKEFPSFNGFDTFYRNNWTDEQMHTIPANATAYGAGTPVFLLLSTILAPISTIQSDWNKYSIAPLNDALFKAFNGAETGLPPEGLLSAFDNAATVGGVMRLIDGQKPSEWLRSVAAFQTRTYSAGPAFVGWTADINPFYFHSDFAIVNSNGSIASKPTVPISISVKDVNQVEVDSVSGLSQNSIDAPGLGQLSPGSYTVTTTASYNGMNYVEKHVFAVVPTQYADFSNAPGLFLIMVDAQGNAIDDTVAVTDGTIINQWPGVVIVDANPTGSIPASITVKNASGVSQSFTQPRPWTRVIPVVVR